MKTNIELSIKVMQSLITSTDLFGKLNTLMAKMHNPYLLTYILEMTDSIASNQIENIHTTVDEAYNQEILKPKNNLSPYVKYRETLKGAHIRLQNDEIIRLKDILWINKNVRGINEGLRKKPIKIEDGNQKVVHKAPPANEVSELMGSLIHCINEDWDQNTIIKSLLIHHEFERIHPFNDGNGRTGRILFALLLNKFNVLNIPATIFSYSLVQEKTRYYQALQAADQGKINSYLEIMLELLIKSLKISLEFAQTYLQEIKRVLSISIIQENKALAKVAEFTFSGVKVSNKYLCNKTKQNNKTVKKYIDMLVELNIIEIEVKGKYRPYKNLIVEKLINKYFA